MSKYNHRTAVGKRKFGDSFNGKKKMAPTSKQGENSFDELLTAMNCLLTKTTTSTTTRAIKETKKKRTRAIFNTRLICFALRLCDESFLLFVVMALKSSKWSLVVVVPSCVVIVVVPM